MRNISGCKAYHILCMVALRTICLKSGLSFCQNVKLQYFIFVSCKSSNVQYLRCSSEHLDLQ